MFQWTLISFFGLFLGLQTINFLCLTLDLNQKQRQNAYVGTIFVLIFVFLILQKQIFVLLMLCFVLFFAPLITKMIIFAYQRRYFRQNIVSFLDAIILQMRLGHSFLDSLRAIAKNYPRWFTIECEIFAESISLDKKISEFHTNTNFFKDLAAVAKQKHKQIDKLKCLRRKIKIEQDFRQKSRSVLIQIRAQCFLLSVMYLCLLIYQLTHGNIQKIQELLVTSLIMFTAGLMWIWRAGRNYKWKT